MNVDALRSWAQRQPLVRRWGRRWAWGLLAVLWSSSLACLALTPKRSLPFLLVAGAAFLLLLAMEALKPCLSRRGVLWASVVLLVVAVVYSPRTSDDVWSYAIYGRLLAHYGADPYKVSPLQHFTDPWWGRVSPWWQDTRSVYGPVFSGLSWLVMGVAGNSVLTARLLFQGLAAGSVLAALGLLYRRQAPAGALVFVGLSPVVVVNGVNGAHNDLLLGFGLLAGVVALEVGRHVLPGGRTVPGNHHGWVLAAGVILGLAALVKVLALLPAAAIALWLWRRDGPRPALILVAGAGMAVVAGYVIAGGPGALGPVQEASRLVDRFSLWSWLGHPAANPTVRGPAGNLLIAPVPKKVLGSAARDVVTLAVAALAVLVVAGGSADERPSAGPAAAVLAFVLMTPYIQPWYVTAALPVLALQWRSRLGFLAAAYSVILTWSAARARGTGLLRAVLKLPLTTLFPAVQALALAGLVYLAVRQLGRLRRTGRPLVTA